MWNRSRTSSHPVGFTLLELLLVMVLLTIVVAIAAPKLSSFAIGRKTNYAAVQMVALAKYARAQAINDGRTYRLNFDASAKPAIWLTVEQSGQYVSPTSTWGKRIELDEGLTVRTDLTRQPTGELSVDFRPDGRTGDGPVHVWISDRQSRVIEIACQSPTELFRILPADQTTVSP